MGMIMTNLLKENHEGLSKNFVTPSLFISCPPTLLWHGSYVMKRNVLVFPPLCCVTNLGANLPSRDLLSVSHTRSCYMYLKHSNTQALIQMRLIKEISIDKRKDVSEAVLLSVLGHSRVLQHEKHSTTQ